MAACADAYFAFFHLARAARRAISRRCSGVTPSQRALAPFFPPSRPQARSHNRLRPSHLGLFTGLRQSEALELTWDRVDRSRGVLLLEVTKSGRRRQVPLNEAADAVLAQRGSKDEGLVFSSSNWDRYRTAWESTVKRAKLIDLHWHDLRHTFASWAVQRRVSLYELKELLEATVR